MQEWLWFYWYYSLYRNITSLKEELLPQLVKAQFQTAHMIKPNPSAQFMNNSQLTTPAIHPTESSHRLVTMTGLASNCHDDLEQLALSMSSGGHSGMENCMISCHAFISSTDSLCIRVNTTDSYKEVNKLVRPYPYCNALTLLNRCHAMHQVYILAISLHHSNHQQGAVAQ